MAAPARRGAHVRAGVLHRFRPALCYPSGVELRALTDDEILALVEPI